MSGQPGERAQSPQPGRVHWLYRPGSARVLWTIATAVLALTLLAQGFVQLHPAFALEDWFGFNAVYGFLACVAMVLFSRALGWLVKRADEYYARRPHARGDRND